MIGLPHANNTRIEQRGRTYYLDGKPLRSPSVSEAVKKFYHQFDVKQAAANTSRFSANRLKSDGTLRSDDEIIQFWASKADYGTRLHDVIEKYYKEQPIDEADRQELAHFFDWEKNGKPPQWKPYWSEQAIWCPHTHDGKYTAGRIDMLYSDGNRFYHVDWKFVEKPDYDYKGMQVYCNCGAIMPLEASDHAITCKAIGPAPETKHLLIHKWTAYASNNSLYCEMLRRNYGFDVAESWLVFLHPNAPTYTQKMVDFDAHSAVVDAILGPKH